MDINIKTYYKDEMIDVTSLIKTEIEKNKWENGFLFINIPHTTAGITINDNTDPKLRFDMIEALTKIIPELNFKHEEGNSEAHIKSSLIGTSMTLPIINSKLLLGIWQGIYFFEFDGPRNRKFSLNFLKTEEK